ncbi:MAG: GNAT family N-acetyltransferase [Acidothermaceae bacterium]
MSHISASLPTGLSPTDIGARVTVRVRLPEGGTEGRFTDVVGELESMDDETLAVRRRDGELVSVAASNVVAAKAIGPSLRSAIDLEGVAARGWPAPDSEWLGRWWLRAAGGFTARANSVRPLGDPGVDLDDALAAVHDWYGARGLPSQLQVVIGSSLDQELRRRGWSAHPEVAVCTSTVSRALGRLAELGADASTVGVSSSPSSGWLSLFRGGDPPPAALAILTGAPTVAFAAVANESQTLAIARGAVEAPWVGLSAIEVAETARRQGRARAVITAVLSWARERGATRCYLEVLASNAPALALYESLGFTEHHRYACLEPPAR